MFMSPLSLEQVTDKDNASESEGILVVVAALMVVKLGWISPLRLKGLSPGRSVRRGYRTIQCLWHGYGDVGNDRLIACEEDHEK